MFTLHETCQEYFQRRLREGWKCISLQGYNAILLSPDGIKRPLDLRHDVLTLRPNAASSGSKGCTAVGAATLWGCVDEVVADGDTTYVNLDDSGDDEEFLVALPNHTSESGTINSVTIYGRARTGSGTYDLNYAGVWIKTNSSYYHFHPASNWTTSYVTINKVYATNPQTTVAWTWTEIDALLIGFQITSGHTSWRDTQTYVEVDYSSVVAPTVTTQAATAILSTSCTGNGNITATGGANATRRGFCYKVGTSGDPVITDSVAYDDGDFGTGAYTKAITGLAAGTGYRVRAYATNSAGTGYGITVQVNTTIIQLAPNSIGLTEVASRRNLFWHILGEAFGLTDDAAKTACHVELANDSEAITDGSTLLGRFWHFVSESIGLTESNVRLNKFWHIINETVGLVDGMFYFFGVFFRFMDEAIGLAEGVVKTACYIAWSDEPEGITEDNVLLRKFKHFVSEVIGLSETSIYTNMFWRFINEAIGLTDDAVRWFEKFWRFMNESMSIGESKSRRFYHLPAVIGEAVGLTETVVLLRKFWHTISEVIGLHDASLLLRKIRRFINETIRLTETGVTLNILTRIINEAISLAETSARTSRFWRFMYDTIGLVDALSKVIIYRKLRGKSNIHMQFTAYSRMEESTRKEE